MARIGLLLSLAVATIGAQELPASTPAYGAFAFSNLAGTELIVTHDVSGAGQLRRAICGGDVQPIALVRRQKDGNASRQSPHFFAQLAGTVFRVPNGGLNPDVACLLAPDSLLLRAEVLKTQPAPKSDRCPEADRSRIAAMRERGIEGCWPLAKVLPRGQISVVEYVRQGAEALASLIVELDGRAVTIDWTAKFKRAGEDLWRVDDGGVFHPEDYGVPFLIRRGSELVIVMRTMGGEGISHAVYVADATGTTTRKVQTEYWYRAAF